MHPKKSNYRVSDCRNRTRRTLLIQRIKKFPRCKVFRYLRILVAVMRYKGTIISLHVAWSSLRTCSALGLNHKASIQVGGKGTRLKAAPRVEDRRLPQLLGGTRREDAGY